MRAGRSTVSAAKNNRARYTAESTVARFGQSLRSEAGVELWAGLASVVATTPEPGYVSLWLREETR